MGRERTAIGLNAKCPLAGRVKTRLCPPLTSTDAAELYEAFLCDLLERWGRLEGMDRVVFYDPPENADFFAQRAGNRWELVPQCAGDLGARLSAESAWFGERGSSAFALLGSDAPTMPTRALYDALEAIQSGRADVAMGPDQDGGYYLVALAEPVPGLFDGVAWSTRTSLAETEANARRAGRRVIRVEPWYDVDTGADLERLRADVDDGSIAAAVPRTATWLKKQRGG